MNIEDYKRQRDAMKFPSQENLSPFKELLEQLFDMVVRLDREACLGGSYGHRVGENGGYRNGYKTDGLPNASGSLNLLSSKTSSSIDTPLYPNTMDSSQRSSEALLNAAAECYIEGVSSREISNIFKLYGIESISSTQVSNTNKKLDEGLNLGEFPYMFLDAGHEKLPVTGIVRDVAVLSAFGIDR